MGSPESKGGHTARRFVEMFSDRIGCPGGARLRPGLKSYFFFDFLAFFAFFDFFAFLAIAYSFGFNGWKRDTRHARRRASLATSSNAIPTDSQAAAPHCHAGVIALSTDVMHFWRIFRSCDAPSAKIPPRRVRSGRRCRFVRVNVTPMRRRGSRRSGTTAVLFINSKPRRRLPRRR